MSQKWKNSISCFYSTLFISKLKILCHTVPESSSGFSILPARHAELGSASLVYEIPDQVRNDDEPDIRNDVSAKFKNFNIFKEI